MSLNLANILIAFTMELSLLIIHKPLTNIMLLGSIIIDLSRTNGLIIYSWPVKHKTCEIVNNFRIGRLSVDRIHIRCDTSHLFEHCGFNKHCFATLVDLDFFRILRSGLMTVFYLEKLMILKFVMTIYLVIILVTALYLWSNRKRQFLIYSQKSNTSFTHIMSWTAIILTIECLIGCFILFQANKYLNLITLFLSSITILIFSLLINQKND